MRDPIELYEYPKEWLKKGDEKKIASGLFIRTPKGWLRRGITTGTTASASIIASIASLKEELKKVTVKTPVGIEVSVKVSAKNGIGKARKFSGDHEFDVTNGVFFVSKTTEEDGIKFGKGIAKDKDFIVSDSAKKQLWKNFEFACELYNYIGGVLVEATYKQKSEKLNGIAILGTTGFVEPWCDKLVKTKVEIAKRYDRIAVTTGRESWKIAKDRFPDFQPFVFGVHLKEIIKAHSGEIMIVGKPGLLKHVFGSYNREEILSSARKLGNVLEVVIC
ncbi:MAG: cobalt-precorrin-5B (C(1))-methyltransferase [Archaeoglobaceae archaeon]|nr:cobalt-precorrin-5B (C(1))-methyltransferase [Archaeoglobaceae archaeon]MDW8128158.1 cobalt-precorrin-5B (C(1))-methyltransferase [Archaeoglobaceae archaeon]